MADKKFKSVKWDDKRQFKKAIKQFKLGNATNNVINEIAYKNIYIGIFNSLLREKNIDYKNYRDETKLLKLYAVLGVLRFIKIDDKQQIVLELNEAINKFSKDKNYLAANVKPHNFESEAMSGYALTDNEVENYFSNDKYYDLMAQMFSYPFNDQKYYDFGYLLAMYISLGTVFNNYNIPNNYNIYLIKLEVQLKMIDVLTYITPINFNQIIINIDKWFKKNNKKFNKLYVRKLGE